MNVEPAFRPAGPSDWDAIWPVFREVVAGGDTYAYLPGISETDARAAWMLTGERSATFVAEVEGEVVGTAYLKPNQPGLGDHVANAGWMVAPDWSGRGIGRRFAVWVIEAARELGFTAMQFNAVVATNRRAIALWRSLGFEVIGTVPAAYRHAEQGPTDAHIMFREL